MPQKKKKNRFLVIFLGIFSNLLKRHQKILFNQINMREVYLK